MIVLSVVGFTFFLVAWVVFYGHWADRASCASYESGRVFYSAFAPMAVLVVLLAVSLIFKDHLSWGFLYHLVWVIVIFLLTLIAIVCDLLIYAVSEKLD